MFLDNEANSKGLWLNFPKKAMDIYGWKTKNKTFLITDLCRR